MVTILLHEDLDIEDEPLSSGDDFLKDIFSMRQTKTREKQKRAAVEFLRSAVCNVSFVLHPFLLTVWPVGKYLAVYFLNASRFMLFKY